MELKGGDKLAQRLAELSRNVSKAARVKIGFQDGSTYPDGTLVAMVAAVNEFGQTRLHPNQPPRPFFRNMINQNADQWPRHLGEHLVEQNYDSEIALGLQGEDIKGQLMHSINELTEPPLASSTIARKGFDKPLIDTGRMINHITSVVSGEPSEGA